jgi:predicted flap endonuclease-1-like 5' DNA nuclease
LTGIRCTTAALAILLAAQPAGALAAGPSLPEPGGTEEWEAPCERRVAQSIAQANITFERGSARIDPRSLPFVGRLAAMMRACPSAQLHLTDDGAQTCDDPVDLALSTARAESVANALVERGVERGRLVTRGTPGNPALPGGGCARPISPPVPSVPLPGGKGVVGTWAMPWLALLAALLIGLVLGYLLHGAKGGQVRAWFARRRANPVVLTPIGVPAAVGPSDDLMQIKGIGPKLNDLLLGLGIRRFDQIAAWTPRDVARVDSFLAEFRGRIAREGWIEQAGLLSRGATGEFEARFGALDYEST